MKPRLEDPDLIRLDIIRSLKFEIMKVSIALLSSCPFGFRWAPNGPVKLYWSKQASECSRTGVCIPWQETPTNGDGKHNSLLSQFVEDWEDNRMDSWMNKWMVSFLHLSGMQLHQHRLIPNDSTFLYFTISRDTLQDLYNTHKKEIHCGKTYLSTRRCICSET